MSGGPDPLYVRARKVLLDVVDALTEQRDVSGCKVKWRVLFLRGRWIPSPSFSYFFSSSAVFRARFHDQRRQERIVPRSLLSSERLRNIVARTGQLGRRATGSRNRNPWNTRPNTAKKLVLNSNPAHASNENRPGRQNESKHLPSHFD